MLAQYRFEKYKKAQDAAGPRVLLTSDPARIDEAVRLAEAVGLVRDLVNTPAGDLGPAELALAAEEALKPFRPALTIHSGGEVETPFPLVAAVGRAAAPAREPCVLEADWGAGSPPRIAIIAKGVCFDSGGLAIKPGSAMLCMTKAKIG